MEGKETLASTVTYACGEQSRECVKESHRPTCPIADILPTLPSELTCLLVGCQWIVVIVYADDLPRPGPSTRAPPLQERKTLYAPHRASWTQFSPSCQSCTSAKSSQSVSFCGLPLQVSLHLKASRREHIRYHCGCLNILSSLGSGPQSRQKRPPP